jgi:hypothetical protein
MMDSTAEKNPTLETVQQQFERWRSDRTKKREPIPKNLWLASGGQPSCVELNPLSTFPVTCDCLLRS